MVILDSVKLTVRLNTIVCFPQQFSQAGIFYPFFPRKLTVILSKPSV